MTMIIMIINMTLNSSPSDKITLPINRISKQFTQSESLCPIPCANSISFYSFNIWYKWKSKQKRMRKSKPNPTTIYTWQDENLGNSKKSSPTSRLMNLDWSKVSIATDVLAKYIKLKPYLATTSFTIEKFKKKKKMRQLKMAT